MKKIVILLLLITSLFSSKIQDPYKKFISSGAVVDIIYKDETQSSSGLDSSPATDSETVFTFAQATLEIPDGTTITDVQGIDLTFENGTNYVFGLGSRKAQQAVPQGRNYTFTLDVPYESAARLYQYFAGASSGPQDSISATTLDIIMDNGGSGTSQRTIHITLSGVYFDEHTLNANSPDDLVREGISGFAKSLSSATYLNDTATDPW